MTPLVAAITALGALTMSMYTPSMPAIAHALGAAPGMVQATLSIYLIGFAVGQLFYGPLSDRFGRRPVLMLGLVIFIAGTAACGLAQSIEVADCRPAGPGAGCGRRRHAGAGDGARPLRAGSGGARAVHHRHGAVGGAGRGSGHRRLSSGLVRLARHFRGTGRRRAGAAGHGRLGDAGNQPLPRMPTPCGRGGSYPASPN